MENSNSRFIKLGNVHLALHLHRHLRGHVHVHIQVTPRQKRRLVRKNEKDPNLTVGRRVNIVENRDQEAAVVVEVIHHGEVRKVTIDAIGEDKY